MGRMKEIAELGVVFCILSTGILWLVKQLTKKDVLLMKKAELYRELNAKIIKYEENSLNSIENLLKVIEAGNKSNNEIIKEITYIRKDVGQLKHDIQIKLNEIIQKVK